MLKFALYNSKKSDMIVSKVSRLNPYIFIKWMDKQYIIANTTENISFSWALP
jgi:hypothetical protein